MLTNKLTSLQHPFVKYATGLRLCRKTRKKEGKVLVMGLKMVEELAHVQRDFETLILEESFAETYTRGIKNRCKEIILVTHDILKKITGLPSPEPLAAILRRPENQNVTSSESVLILDGLQDPGNVGTLIRTALCLGWKGAFVVEGTCDPYNEKALRAAKGATFKLPLQEGKWDEVVEHFSHQKRTTFLAHVEGQDVRTITTKSPIAVILSQESIGPRKEALALFPAVTIPLKGSMDSLNVACAGAIVLDRLQRGL